MRTVRIVQNNYILDFALNFAYSSVSSSDRLVCFCYKHNAICFPLSVEYFVTYIMPYVVISMVLLKVLRHMAFPGCTVCLCYIYYVLCHPLLSVQYVCATH